MYHICVSYLYAARQSPAVAYIGTGLALRCMVVETSTLLKTFLVFFYARHFAQSMSKQATEAVTYKLQQT